MAGAERGVSGECKHSKEHSRPNKQSNNHNTVLSVGAVNSRTSSGVTDFADDDDDDVALVAILTVSHWRLRSRPPNASLTHSVATQCGCSVHWLWARLHVKPAYAKWTWATMRSGLRLPPHSPLLCSALL